MKAALSYVCVVIGIVVVVASCGPQKKFCPGTIDNLCVIDLDSGALDEDSGTSTCSPGYRLQYDSATGTFMCVLIPDGGN
jgi:hypothetical protein